MKTALIPVLGTMAVLFAAVALRAGNTDTAGRREATAPLCQAADTATSRRPRATHDDPCRHGLEEL